MTFNSVGWRGGTERKAEIFDDFFLPDSQFGFFGIILNRFSVRKSAGLPLFGVSGGIIQQGLSELRNVTDVPEEQFGPGNSRTYMNHMVSVVSPVYNTDCRYFRECLDSVLSELECDIELIPVDDGSAHPHCRDIISEYAARDSRVKPVFLPEHRGAGFARNRGLDIASGKYLMFLDSDDRYAPGLISHVAGLMESRGDIDILEFKLTRNSSRLDRFAASEAPALPVPAGRIGVSICTKIYRSSVVGGFRFDESLPMYEDIPYIIDVHNATRRIFSYPRTGYFYRRTENSTSSRNRQHRGIVGVIPLLDCIGLRRELLDDPRSLRLIRRKVGSRLLSALKYIHLHKSAAEQRSLWLEMRENMRLRREVLAGLSTSHISFASLVEAGDYNWLLYCRVTLLKLLLELESRT